MDFAIDRRPKMELFAEAQAATSPWWWGSLTAFALLVGGAIKWAWDEWRANKKEKETLAAAKEATYISQLEGTVARQKADAQDLMAECEEKNKENANLRVYLERKNNYARYLQSLLKARQIPFDVWNGESTNGKEAEAEETKS